VLINRNLYVKNIYLLTLFYYWYIATLVAIYICYSQLRIQKIMILDAANW